MSAIGFIWIAIFVFRAISRGSSGGSTASGTQLRWRWILWGTLVAAWGIGGLVSLVPGWAYALSPQGGSRSALLVVVGLTAIFVALGVLLFSPWTVLRPMTRLGRPRLVCAMAHVSLVFLRTGETRSAATLLAALAIGHRGIRTEEERVWLERRLRHHTRYLGTFGVAHAFVCGLEARALRERGELAEAYKWEETARGLLGTATYLSKVGVPKPVLALAYEYLALDAARHGMWGGARIPPELSAPKAWTLRLVPKLRFTKAHRTLEAWIADRLVPEADVGGPRPPLAATSPLAVALLSRNRAEPPVENARDVQLRASRIYASLWRGQAVAPREALNMLVALDVLTHPMAPDSLIPAPLREDAAQVDAIHDEVANAVAEALGPCDVPLFALPRVGPVSARVYQKVESALFAEWTRTIAQIDDRRRGYERRDGYAEWLEVSRVRRLYRRIEFCLGEAAVRPLWPQFAYSYGYLGVRLSEEYPRMRPLAHAVFACMAREAERFGDVENVDRQATNMRITSGEE